MNAVRDRAQPRPATAWQAPKDYDITRFLARAFTSAAMLLARERVSSGIPATALPLRQTMR